MSTVYLALVAGPGGFNKLLVVKVLRDDLMGGSDDAVRMFWNEARLAAQLVHPNIVHTFEVGETDGLYFMAMEYLDGQSYRAVQTRAASVGGIPLSESLRVLSEAARGLHYSHELKSFKGEPLGVVHRDVSPQNVMITFDGQVKVLDFGIAKMRDSEHLTQAGMIKGKLEYVAPEQLKGEPLDGRADVFALGAMLWEAITGERFAGGSKVADVAKVHTRLSGGERKLRSLRPDAPEPLAQIVDRATALDPSARFGSAAAFADALDAYLATLPVKPSAQTLASFVGPLFAAEREKLHQLIEEEIERSSHTQSGQLPQIGGDSTTSSNLSWGRGDGSGSGLKQAVVPTSDELPRRNAARTRAMMWGVVGVAAVIGAALALLPPSQGPVHPVASGVHTPAAAPPSAAAPPTAVAPLEPTIDDNVARSVLLEVKVTPEHAVLSLDGAPLAVPFSGRFRKSDSLQLLEAKADGFRPYKRLIPFVADQQLDIRLEPEPQPQPQQPPQASRRGSARASGSDRRAEQAPEPPPQKATAAAPAPPPVQSEPGAKLAPPGTNRRRTLIVSDPYAKPEAP